MAVYFKTFINYGVDYFEKSCFGVLNKSVNLVELKSTKNSSQLILSSET
ncbi:hypothetical protein Aeqsu_0503 [Aequorivita sublithincola DSM 14238]|uniref:Uncharacterized protein n=1 Tax=Aequorivita sublithincola (strain DSM 14238 / LMG 21431 / ACAM 643 / 9-3) TaxID=746697 RepID=I3YSP7_AEQSU|nr:hypothetical protein Aeqsu_0503 [Aequorivita sublithincola DSM 14238]